MDNGAGLPVKPSNINDRRGVSLRKIEVYKGARKTPLISRSSGEPYISPRTTYRIKTKLRELAVKQREKAALQPKPKPKSKKSRGKSWLQTMREIRRRGRASRKKSTKRKTHKRRKISTGSYPPSYPKTFRKGGHSKKKTHASHALKKEKEWWKYM